MIILSTVLGGYGLTILYELIRIFEFTPFTSAITAIALEAREVPRAFSR